MNRRNRFYLWLSRHPAGRIVLHLLALRRSLVRRAHVRGILREFRQWRHPPG